MDRERGRELARELATRAGNLPPVESPPRLSLREIAALAPRQTQRPRPTARVVAPRLDPPRERPQPPRPVARQTPAEHRAATRRTRRRKLDPDVAFIARALAKDWITVADIDACRARAELESDGPTHLSQLLVRDGRLTAEQFVEIANFLGRALYECPRCRTRHRRVDLDGARAVPCAGCGVGLSGVGATLSSVEIMVARDPMELSIALRVT